MMEEYVTGRVRYTPGGNLRSLSGRHWWRPGCASVALQSVMDSVPRTRTRCPHGSAENTGRTRASSSAVRTKLSEWRPHPDFGRSMAHRQGCVFGSWATRGARSRRIPNAAAAVGRPAANLSLYPPCQPAQEGV